MPRTVARQLLDACESEAALQAKVLALAARTGWRAYHTHDSRRSQPGFPDLVLCRGPLLVLAECKREGKDPTPAQTAWLEALRGVRQVAVRLWRPGDWDEIETMLCRRD